MYIQVLQRILMGTDVVKNVNKNNASHAVLFEALALVSLRLYHPFCKYKEANACIFLIFNSLVFSLFFLLG